MSKTSMQNFVIAVVAVVAVIISSQRFSTVSNLLTFNEKKENEVESTFDLKLANLSNANIIGDARVTLEPTFTPSYLGDFEMTVKKPGDGISYTFDIENTGTEDAKISSVNITNPVCTSTVSNPNAESYVCDNIIYTLTYTGTDDEVKVGDKINSNEIVSLTLDVSYNGAAWYTPVVPMIISGISADISFE